MKLKLVNAIVLMAMLLVQRGSQAQFIVHDPLNLAKNLLTAAQTAQSNLNEVEMIRHQFEQLANDALNLEKIDLSFLENFQDEMGELFEAVGKVQGLMQEYISLEERFSELYPELENEPDEIPTKKIIEQSKAWLAENREMVKGAALTGAKALENLPKSQAHLTELLATSSGSLGILQAAQTGNEISAQISQSLLTLQSQLATYSQAHMSQIMRQVEDDAALRNRLDHVLDGYEKLTEK